MNGFLHQLLAGISSGSIYGSLGLALVMIYQSTRHVNFAQGEMAMFSTFLAWAMIQAGLPYYAAFAATVVLSFLMGMVIEVVIVRPMNDKPMLSAVVVFIGLLVIFRSLAGWLFDYTVRQFPSPFPADAWFASQWMPAHQVGAIFVSLTMVALLFSFLRLTPLGLAMRAAAQNPRSARLVGVGVDRMLMLGWGLAAAIGAVAGMMIAPVVFLDPEMMSGVLLYAFAGALVGGIDSPMGTVIGGFIVGILENLVGAYVVGSELKLAVALVLIIGVLMVRPAGLFGRAVVTRV